MKKNRNLMNAALLAGAFSVVIIYSLKRLADTDLWGHLKCGEYFFQHRRILTTHLFNCSWPDAPYLNHEWLYQALVYAINHLVGEGGLVALQVSLIVFSFFLLYRTTRMYTDNVPLLAFMVTLGAVASAHRFLLRPQHFTYVFFLFTLFSLHQYQRGDRRYASFLPLVMIPWVNTHAESVWGILVPAVFIVLEYLKRYWGAGLDNRELKRLGVILILTVLASLLNPFTYRTVIHPFIVMGEQFAGVEELLSPVKTQFIYFWIYCTLFVLSCLLNLKRLDPTWLVLSLIYAGVGWMANRGIPHFVFVSAPFMARNFDAFFREQQIPGQRILARGFIVGLIIWIGVLASVVASPIFMRKYQGYPYPEGALRFLRENHITGNVFNHHPWGGFIIWNAYPDLRPYIDGRFFQKRFYDEYYSVLGVMAGWQDLLARYDITITLLPYSPSDSGSLNDRLFSSLAWHLVYWDDVSLLYLRDSSGNDRAIREFGNHVFNPDRQLYQYEENRPEIIGAASMAAERNLRFAGNSYKALILAGTMAFLNGDYARAAEQYEEALRFMEEKNAWIYYRLAMTYRKLGDLEQTEANLRKCLAIAPDAREAAAMLRELEILLRNR